MTEDLSKLKILVAGTARNCEKTIRQDVAALNKALGFCQEVFWLIIESDSSDATTSKLESMAREFGNFRFFSLGRLAESLPLRTQRLAHCRNIYLDELWSNPIYADVSYLVVADFDGMNHLITAEGFQSCWTRSDWAACTANQRGPYYDIWALRHCEWNPGDWMKQHRFLSTHGVGSWRAGRAALYSKMITINETGAWIEVDSAFGGLAIYRRNALGGARYFGVNEVGEEICEHVSLNSQIRSRGHRIFINPRLINAGITRHAREGYFFSHSRRCIVDLLRKGKRRLWNQTRRTDQSI